MKKAVGFTILGVSMIVLLVLRFNNLRADNLETGTFKADNVIEELVEVIEEDDEIIEETVEEEVTVEIETEKEIEDVEIEDVEIVEEQSIDLPVTGNTQAVQAQEPAAPRRQEVQQVQQVQEVQEAPEVQQVQETPEVEQVSEPVVVKPEVPEVPATPKYTPNSLYINGEKVAGVVSGNVVTGISSIPVGTVMITDASGEGRNITVGTPFEVSASNIRFDSGDDVSVLLNGNAGVVFIQQKNEFLRLVAQGY